jgi:uncharacterized protein
VRSGGVKDDEEDYALPIWAGVLPLRLAAGQPVTDELTSPAMPVPDHVSGWRRPAPAKEA